MREALRRIANALPDVGNPQVQLSRSTWRQVETVIVNFFRAEGGEILADSGIMISQVVSGECGCDEQ